MPNEPEREIEKTLKAYAKERADAADTVLHPATRRLLLDEAAEAYPASQVIKNTWRWSWYFSWPQLAPAFGIVLLLAMASFFMWPAHRARREMLLALNREDFTRSPKSEMSPIVRPARNFEAADALDQSIAAKRSMNSEPLVSKDAAAAGAFSFKKRNNLADSYGNVPPIVADQPRPEPVAPAAAPTPQVMSSAESSAVVTDVFVNATAPKDVPAFGGAAATVTNAGINVTYDLAAMVRSRDFVSLKSTTPKPANVKRVLKKFRVEQSGEVLRIVDGDGSVYVGNWESALGDRVKRAESLTLNKNAEGSASGVNTNWFTTGIVRNFYSNEHAHFFRVSGTNLSLKQTVVFKGRFDRDLKLEDGGVGGKNANPKIADETDFSKWLTGEISGDATVGSNVLKILAKPATEK